MTGNLAYAILLTSIAGLATGIGGLSIFFTRKFSGRFLAVTLGFSAGVMLFISLAELFPEAKGIMSEAFGKTAGQIYTLVSFFSGMLLIAVIDRMVPKNENPHEFNYTGDRQSIKKGSLMKIGVVSAAAIAIHNFPEGIATFATAMNDTGDGIKMMIAIAFHNLPEGIAVAVPVYYATGKKGKAFLLSLLSGLAEPLGGLVGYIILANIFEGSHMGIILAAVAGIMVYISIDELLPTAEKYGEHHPAIAGVITGMAFMGMTLLFA